MIAKIRELRQNRFKLIKEARAILDSAADENLTAEDQTKYDKIMSDIDGLKNKIDKQERMVALESEMEAKEEKPELQSDERSDKPKEEEDESGHWSDAPAYRKAFARYLINTSQDPAKSPETRALQVDSDTAGGYVVAPQQFVNQLIQEKDNLVFMRRLARTWSVPNAVSLGAPSLDNDPADPTWTKEIAIGSEDSTMSFGKRELYPHPLAQFLKVSNTLLRKSMQGPEALVRNRLAFKGAVVEENAFLNGSGADQPLGVFTSSANGISTSRDVSTGNTTTAIRTDNLRECKYTLKKQYRAGNCAWIFHRDAIKMISKLKDGNGQYIWQASLTSGDPDRILGFPVYESEYAPSTFTTGLYVGILGDFSYYWIADSLNMTIQKLVELYAAANQTGFISRLETDGMPILESAFVRVKLA